MFRNFMDFILKKNNEDVPILTHPRIISYNVRLTPNVNVRDDGYAPLSVPLLTSGSYPL